MTTPGFHETRLPEHVEAGAKGGPEFNTTVIEMTSGREQRVKRWALPRYSWDLSYGIMDQEDYNAVMAFFMARRGRAFGFRFKDWSDYRGTSEAIGTGDAVAIAATATLTINTNPADTNTVTINGQAYTFKTGSSSNPFEVHVGVDIATTRLNLINAINATGIAGITTYGIGTTQHPTVAASAGTAGKMIATARTAGTGGNSLTVTETIDGSWDHSPLSGGLAAGSTGSGTDTFQLVRNYDDDILPFVRRITRPVDTTIIIYDNGSPVSDTHYTASITTGQVVFDDGFVPLDGHLITADFEFDLPVRFDSDKIEVVLDWVDAGTVDTFIIRELREGEDS